jgi:hypothetical protein
MKIYNSKKIKNVYISLYFGKEDMLEKRFKKYVILFLDKDMNFQGLSKKFPCQLKESKILLVMQEMFYFKQNKLL